MNICQYFIFQMIDKESEAILHIYTSFSEAMIFSCTLENKTIKIENNKLNVFYI